VLLLDGFVVVVVLVGLMIDNPQNLDEAEGGPQPPQSRLLVRVELSHGRAGYRRGGSSRRAPRWR
jgi:hypothetical protein